jgi:cytochrome P450 family 9
MHELGNQLYSQLDGHKIGGMFQLMQPVYLVRDPELVKHVTVKDFEHFVDLPVFIPEDHEPILAKNLQGLKGK